MYSGDHRESFPDDLKSLQPYCKQSELFVCPSHELEVDFPIAWHEAKKYGSYYYIAGLTEADDEDRVHMFDLPSTHSGQGGNVLHASGYVAWYSTQSNDTTFWEVLAESGITPEVLSNATSRIIHVDDLQFLKEGE